MKCKLTIIGMVIILSAALSSCSGKENDTAEKKSPADKGDHVVTFVELGSENCIPCKMMKPVMKKVEEKYGSQVRVVFHDVGTSEGRPYAQSYSIRVIPTQVFLDENGKEFFRHEGFFPFDEVDKVLKKQGVQ